MTRKIVVIGGGAAGIGAAGAAKGTDGNAEVRVFTEYEDVGYSPCGIPYVHGREIPDFERLFLAQKQTYVDAGIDISYETKVVSIHPDEREVALAGGERVPYDRLILGTGWKYEPPGVPGDLLDGLYYVKNIREAMTWDARMDDVKAAVVTEASPIGLEMATALVHRGIETHLLDPQPWLLADAADPDIMELVEDSLRELGVHIHLDTKFSAFLGQGQVRAVETSDGEIAADLVVVASHKVPDVELASAAGLKIGSTGALIVNARMETSVPAIFAAGDCVELPHVVTGVPITALTGSHAYAQGKVAGTNAAGGNRHYNQVYVPWGLPAGNWVVGGASTGETLATALGVPFVMGVATGISRARYYEGFKQIKVKLLFDPKSLKLIGAQMVGGEGIKERADFLGMSIKLGATVHDLAWMENVYSPPIGALNEPIALAAQDAVSRLEADK
jgi:NADH oxidase (H2O2-forming)